MLGTGNERLTWCDHATRYLVLLVDVLRNDERALAVSVSSRPIDLAVDHRSEVGARAERSWSWCELPSGVGIAEDLSTNAAADMFLKVSAIPK